MPSAFHSVRIQPRRKSDEALWVSPTSLRSRISAPSGGPRIFEGPLRSGRWPRSLRPISGSRSPGEEVDPIDDRTLFEAARRNGILFVPAGLTTDPLMLSSWRPMPRFRHR